MDLLHSMGSLRPHRHNKIRLSFRIAGVSIPPIRQCDRSIVRFMTFFESVNVDDERNLRRHPRQYARACRKDRQRLERHAI